MKKKGSNFVSAPLGVAIWLLRRGLTVEQVSDFCSITHSEAERLNVPENLMPYDVKGIRPVDPIQTLDLTQDVLDSCIKDPSTKLIHAFDINKIAPGLKLKKVGKNDSLSYMQKQVRPNVILYLVINGFSDAFIKRTTRTTYDMIEKVKTKTYKDFSSLVPKDPVLEGFCTQADIDRELEKMSS